MCRQKSPRVSRIGELTELMPWWVGTVGKVTAGYADGAGSIPALGRVRHGDVPFGFCLVRNTHNFALFLTELMNNNDMFNQIRK